MKQIAVRVLAAALAAVSSFAMSVSCDNANDDLDKSNVTISVEPAELDFAWDETLGKSAAVKTNAPSFEVSTSYSWIGAEVRDGQIYVWMKSENSGQAERDGSVQVFAVGKNGDVLAECAISISQQAGEDGTSTGESQFADPIFAAYVLENFDYDQDGVISKSEAESVKSIDVDSYGVTSLEGISMFTNLEDIDLSGNAIKVVDLRDMDKLQYLVLQNSGTETLLLGGCTGLTSIIARNNSLKDVDLSDQTGIQFLDLGQNLLTSFSISGRSGLQYVAVDMNSLSTLTIEGCPNIKTLACHKNSLEALDITSMPRIDWLDCSDNNIKSLDLPAGSALISLMCSDNLLKSLDLGLCSSLKYLTCRTNMLESIDVTACKDIVKLDCGANPIADLQLEGCTNLVTLLCDNCSLEALDLAQFAALETLECNGNAISTLDVSSNSLLARLYCQDNGMKTLYVADGQTIADLKKDTGCEILIKGQEPVVTAKVVNVTFPIGGAVSGNSVGTIPTGDDNIQITSTGSWRTDSADGRDAIYIGRTTSNDLTIYAQNGVTITKITMTAPVGYVIDLKWEEKDSFTEGTYSGGDWTGSLKSRIVFKPAGGSHSNIASISVEYTE
ncbi:MAG: leucine-rich repeat domain-containing protein [Candidatus Cryptobacteroides sp.]